MKVKCDSCRKKLLVDDAFAGGVCRCPYCKHLINVPGKPGSGIRIIRPASPPRPAAPGQTPPAAQDQPVKLASVAPQELDVPMAQPAAHKWAIALLIAALLGAIALVIVVLTS